VDRDVVLSFEFGDGLVVCLAFRDAAAEHEGECVGVRGGEVAAPGGGEPGCSGGGREETATFHGVPSCGREICTWPSCSALSGRAGADITALENGKGRGRRGGGGGAAGQGAVGGAGTSEE